MAGEFRAVGAVSLAERAIRDRCVPLEYSNRGAAAGEVLPIRTQVHLAVVKSGDDAAADLHHLRDGRSHAGRRRHRRSAAAETAVVRAEVCGTPLEESHDARRPTGTI